MGKFRHANIDNTHVTLCFKMAPVSLEQLIRGFGAVSQLYNQMRNEMHKASFGTSEGSVGKEPESPEAGRGCSCSVVSFFVDRNGTCRISPDLLEE